MTAKAYLRQLRHLENAIETMKSELIRLRTKIESPGGPKYTASRGQYSTGDALENGVIKLSMLEGRIVEKLAEYEETRERIIEEILSLPDPVQAKVLYAVYVDGLPIWKTAMRLHYSDRHIKTIHGRALTEFYNRIISKQG